MNEMMSAGPAPYRITSPVGETLPAAAVPRVEKIPAPMTAPMERATRSRVPRVRFMPPSEAAAIGFLENRPFIEARKLRSGRHLGQSLRRRFCGDLVATQREGAIVPRR